MAVDVLLVEDHQVVRDGICALLERAGDFRVLGAVATGAGALIGAFAGGGKGAAIGAGVGAGASLIFVQMATKGPNVSFAPGSEIILDVSERR